MNPPRNKQRATSSSGRRKAKKSATSAKPERRSNYEASAIKRRRRIHEEIQSGSFPNKPKLARLLEVYPDTIKRDIRILIEEGMPIAFNSKKNGYYYTRPVTHLPNIRVTEKEIGALATLDTMMNQLPGKELANHLTSVRRKIQRGLADHFTCRVTDARKHFSIRYTSESIVDGENMDILCRAIVEQKQLRLLYRKPGDKEFTPRTFDPYHLAGVNGEWFLFAYDYLRKEVRRFTPIRMRELQPTGVSFVRPPDFDVDRELQRSFGIQSDEGLFDIVLRTKAAAADFIREKRWRGQTKQVELPCGGVELHLTLSSLREIERFIMSYLGNIVVLQPAELAQRIRQHATTIVCEQTKALREMGFE